MHYAFWTIVSWRIFIVKSWNFAQSCPNSSRIWGLFFFGKKKYEKNVEKNQKNLLGVFPQVMIDLKKILLQKDFF